MPEYRLTTEHGDVVASETLEHDLAAVSWRTAQPFETSQAGEDDTRHLHLERRRDDGWVRIEAPLGTADAS